MIPFLASVPPAPSADALSFQTALLIVLTAGVLYCAFALADLRRRVDRLGARPAPAPIPPAAAAPVSPLSPPASATDRTPPPVAPEASMPPHLLAIIAASVHATLGRHHRILSISPALATPGTAWSVEGRRDVFSSHHVR